MCPTAPALCSSPRASGSPAPQGLPKPRAYLLLRHSPHAAHGCRSHPRATSETLGPSSSLTRSLPPLDQPRSPLPASVASPRCLAPHSLPASIASPGPARSVPTASFAPHSLPARSPLPARLAPHSPAAPIRSPGQTVPAARLAPHSLRPAECRGWSCRSQRALRAPPPHTRPEPDAGRLPAECR